MIAIFDRQHFGKPGRSDVGAAYDVDQDGHVEWQEQEIHLTPLYYEPAIEALTAAGHRCHLLDQGWYRDRHQLAIQISKRYPGQPTAYIACHVNAGRGDYAAGIHDWRSRGGARLAEAIAASLGDAGLPGVERSLVRSASRTNGWRRGLSTIEGIIVGPAWLSGLCFEPYFLDNPDHAGCATPEGGALIGQALARGLIRWGEGV